MGTVLHYFGLLKNYCFKRCCQQQLLKGVCPSSSYYNMSFPLPWHPCGLPSKLIKLRTQLKTNPSKKMHPCDSVTVMRCLSQSKGQLLLKGTVGLNQRRYKTVLLHKAFHSARCGTATGTSSFCRWMYLEWFLKLRWALPVRTQSFTCWVQNSIFRFKFCLREFKDSLSSCLCRFWVYTVLNSNTKFHCWFWLWE